MFPVGPLDAQHCWLCSVALVLLVRYCRKGCSALLLIESIYAVNVIVLGKPAERVIRSTLVLLLFTACSVASKIYESYKWRRFVEALYKLFDFWEHTLNHENILVKEKRGVTCDASYFSLTFPSCLFRISHHPYLLLTHDVGCCLSCRVVRGYSSVCRYTENKGSAGASHLSEILCGQQVN